MRRLSFLLTLGFLTAALGACSSLQRRQEMQTPPPPAKTEAAPAPSETEAAVEALRDIPETMTATAPSVGRDDAANEVQITLKDANGKVVSRSGPVTSAPVAEGVPAEKALTWLHNGNLRFVRGRLRADGQSKADIRRVAAGQKPHSIVFTSSDSRIPPEIVFDQKLGEIYVVRNWGPTVDGSSVQALEHAVRDLGVHLLLILTVKGDPDGNADDVIRELGKRSEVLRTGLNERTLHIQTANYDLRNGVVEFR